ncbi:hypothetical protein DFH05DRAFT_1041194 [Lentinula detonsa]|uniref:Uncharacterized protein n=1 Tax=Lentinula detonsa TaxID=2804962 RepID=A0A9W8P2N5_9AGAR|nr:hypothetical protein DFH05DRAFT_1041194 [Lentinula detonsa]
MSSTISSSALSLPIEIYEQILTSFWNQPQSTHDRAIFMKSSLAVSQNWAMIYMRIFSQDVYIPSGEFALKFLEILRDESPVYHSLNENGALLNRRCRSITFQRDNDGVIVKKPIAPDSCRPTSVLVQGMLNTPTPEHPMGLAIYAVTRFLYSSNKLPELRRISILFANSTMSDLFTRNNFIGFPTQVTELDIQFTYDARTPRDVLRKIRRDASAIGLLPCSIKGVRTLRIAGLSNVAVRELVSSCAICEVVHTDRKTYRFGSERNKTSQA